MSESNRRAGWAALVGGGFLNIALGTYYAWSVFVPAVEREVRLEPDADFHRADD